MTTTVSWPALIIAGSLLLCACSGSKDSGLFSAESDLRRAIAKTDLTGDPASGRDLPEVNGSMAQLGMKLFFSKALGGDQDSACVSCHHPMLGGGDNLSLSIGVQAEFTDLLGPGRVHSSAGTEFDGGPTVPRNAPSTFNIGLWDSVLFHDGRVESLNPSSGSNGSLGGIRTPDSSPGTADPDAGSNLAVAQARFPVTSPEEMRGFDFEAGNSNQAVRDHLALRLQGAVIPAELGLNDWLAEFRLAFNQPAGQPADLITYANIAEAIAAYERSQVFTNTPWKAWLAGDADAISEQAKQGALLFFRDINEGGANCASCHSGDFFTDEKFHVLAMPQIGRGKHDDNGVNSNDDFGRFRETGEPHDKYAFRTPTLLNAEVTGPWSHAGAYTTLAAVVRHHLDPQQAVDNYDYGQLDSSVQTADMEVNTRSALAQLQRNRDAGMPTIRDVSLSDDQIGQLVAFIESLTDPCVKDRECLSAWIPQDGDIDPDGLRVQAFDQHGNPL